MLLTLKPGKIKEKERGLPPKKVLNCAATKGKLIVC
jgi:hypothetical protein